MKRIGNLYGEICSMDNLRLADAIARRGKKHQQGIKEHDSNWDANMVMLQEMLINKNYKTSPYKTFTIFEPKERKIFALPFFPDRIAHHAIMNVLEPVFTAMFTADTYSCIKRRGIHGAANAVKAALKDKDNTLYALKLDIKKYYPSVDHDVLKALLRRKLKDADLLTLLDEIIDSAEGLPIGNYLSQYFANFYLTWFDHWLKQDKGVKYYFRYADDIVILHSDKAYLHNLLSEISHYLQSNLKLTVKDNHQVFPIAARGLDFVGYKFYHTHTLVRKRIKKNCARMIAKRNNPASRASYKGWFKHCNSKHLIKKLFRETI